jgi:exosome complex component RRP42
MEGKYALELIEKGKRIDGRKFGEFRPIQLNVGVIQTAEGSAWVKFGETEVIAGVKMGIGEPFSDTPNEGVLMVGAEFTPLASPDFEAGPPGENAVELARVVDRGIRESNAIDLEKLVITAGEKVWLVFIDIHIINHQGNLLDAAALASVAALLNTKMPKRKDDEILRGEVDKDLPVKFKPITITIGKVNDNYIIDPNFEEEAILDARLSIAVRDDDKVCALQKQGIKELSFEEVEEFVKSAMKKSKELRKLLE